MLVNSIQNPLIGGQFRGSKGKGGRQRGGIHVSHDFELVQANRRGGLEALLHSKSGLLGEEQK